MFLFLKNIKISNTNQQLKTTPNQQNVERDLFCILAVL